MSFATLALICLVALAGPLVAIPRGFHVPVVIGELAVGFFLGATGIGVLDAGDPTFAFLSQVGFGLVMFVAGSHVPMRDPGLRQGFGAGLARAAAIGVLSVPLGLVLADVFGTGHAALYAVLLASSSASLVLPSLNGTPLTARPIVAMLAQLAIADAACIVALPLVIDPQNAPRAAIGTLAVVAVSGILFLVLRTIEANGWRHRVHALSEERGLAIELRTSLTLLFAIAALATAMHVSVMLAGFAFGVTLAGVGEPRRLAHQLFALTEGLFAPLFFVWLGAALNLRNLLEHPSAILLGLALGIGAVGVHAVLAVSRQPLPVATITCAQLGVPVAAVTMGQQLGVLAPGEGSAILLAALGTIAVVALAVPGVVRVAGGPADGAAARPR